MKVTAACERVLLSHMACRLNVVSLLLCLCHKQTHTHATEFNFSLCTFVICTQCKWEGGRGGCLKMYRCYCDTDNICLYVLTLRVLRSFCVCLIILLSSKSWLSSIDCRLRKQHISVSDALYMTGHISKAAWEINISHLPKSDRLQLVYSVREVTSCYFAVNSYSKYKAN